MKNVIIMLAVIAMAAPLYAADPCDVEFSGVGTGGSLVISYTCNDPCTPRGIGLKCEVLNGDTVDVDSGAVVVDPCFNTFIDYAFMDPCNFTIGAGHPMADPCFAGVLDPCTGVYEFSICMGVLDQTGNKNAGPAASSPLVSIPLASTVGSVTIRISEDILRGGVVGSALSTNLPIDVVVSFDCYVIGQPRYYDELMNPGSAITQANYDAWVAVGKPDCWCCPHHGYGDVNGDGWINASDMVPVNNNLGTGPVLPANLIHADVNHDGWINASDMVPVNNRLGTQLPSDCLGVCP
ncbi:MAG: hypothetical protein KAT56_11005 [Sedimentisphaerales bacterium]|nr:hypothetical protein [Sedimentisphaerales bacterium]